MDRSRRTIRTRLVVALAVAATLAPVAAADGQPLRERELAPTGA